MPKTTPPRPPLLISLLNMRRTLNKIATQFDLDHPVMEDLADLQSHLIQAFRGAKELLTRQ